MKESDLKRQVWDYLQYKTNAGELYFDRLNSGAIYEKRGNKTFGVQLCREGTADFMVIRKDTYNVGDWLFPAIIFLELKGDKGKQSPRQKEFQKLVEAQGAEYFIVKSIEELEMVLK